MVKSALTSDVGEVIFVTDSTIALSWCSNQEIKLRLYVYNQVMTILRLFEWITGSKANPLWHIDGNLNLADLLTKKHDIRMDHVSRGSDWIEGLDWMKLDSSEMPLTSYDQLHLDKPIKELVEKECFPEAFTKEFTSTTDEDEPVDDYPEDDSTEFSVLAAAAGKGVAELLVDPVLQGWRRAMRITGYLQGWRTSYCHKGHLIPNENCRICKLGEHKWDPRNETKKAEDYFFRWESGRVREKLKAAELKKFRIQDGIVPGLSAQGPRSRRCRINMINTRLEVRCRLYHQIPQCCMLISCISTPNHWLILVLNPLSRKMRVVKGLRCLIRKIIASCIKCRLMEKKTLELRLQNHPEARTVLAPCCHSCMMDICYGFKGQSFKRSRTVIKIYGLVIVCLLSGATNIMALEGIETQDVCAAIERHANRFGVPVDNGTQLKALKYAKFSIRDIECQVQDQLGIKIIVSNAKAHSEQGRVERRIRALRESL